MLLLEVNYAKIIKNVGILNDAEIEILELIRSKSLLRLVIRFDNENEIDLVEATKKQTIKLEARFIDIILKKEYQSIKIQTQNGKITHIENTIKKKYK